MKTELTVRNCPIKFRFECPQTWQRLTATHRPEIRQCDQCQELVYLCVSDAETIEHAKAGHCIAREMPHKSELPMMVLGRPSELIVQTPSQEKALAWVTRERGIDDAIKNADAPRNCPECGYPAQNWREACRVCNFEIGRVKANRDNSV